MGGGRRLVALLLASCLACVSSGFLGLGGPANPPKHNPLPPPPPAPAPQKQKGGQKGLWSVLRLDDGRRELSDVIGSLTDSVTPGALGRLASVMVLHPLDCIKTRAQLVSMQTRRTAEAAIFRSRADFKGIVPAIAGQVPNGLLTCVGYEMWKDALQDAFPSMSARTRTVASAVLGDLCGHVWIVPAEVVKCQVMAGLHTNAGSAVMSLAKQGPGAFFKGYRAQVARDVPYRAVQLVLFDELSRAFAKTKKRKRLTMGETLLTGAVAGSAAAALTTPLDLIKTRLMLSAQSPTFRAAVEAARKEGITVFTGSVAPKMIYIGASTAAFFAVYEAARKSGMLAA